MALLIALVVAVVALLLCYGVIDSALHPGAKLLIVIALLAVCVLVLNAAGVTNISWGGV